ncbi:hypothetical protein KR009_002246, partial [Drosophila setifemur]
IQPIGDWQKLKILLWKNWILQRNQKLQIIVVLILPVIFLMLIVILRILVQPTEKPELHFKPVSIANLKLYHRSVLQGNRIIHENGTLNIPKHYICYTPDTLYYGNIIKMVLIRLGFLGWRSYETADLMERDLVNHNYFAGVQFEDGDLKLNAQGYPLVLNYSLRFPSELRTMRGPIIDTWRTESRFLRYDMSGARNWNSSDGGLPVGYIMEGFLPLQHAITMSWLELASAGNALSLPPVHLQRFPYNAYIYDPLISGLRQLLPFIILLSFIYPCSVVSKFVTSEKELQLKEIMKLIGVHNWLHWIAWFIKSYLLLMVIVGLMMILMLIRFYGSVAILTFSHWFPVLMFLHTYVVTSNLFCFMLAVFFKKASTAASVTCILWFLTYIPYSFAYHYYDRISLVGKMLICFVFSNSALGFGFHIIMDWEGTGEGVTFSNMFKPVSADDDLTLLHVILMLTFGGLCFLGICLYVEQVMPGDYGVPRPWNFFLKPNFCCSSKRDSKKLKNSNSQENITDKDTSRRQQEVGVRLINLEKSFGKHKAVRGLSLKMYRNEITVLLGHNGAGKTTTLNMMTGIIPPTRGTAILNGYDIRREMEKARQSLGICPQNNILFNHMSVRDHIKFFSKLKGVRGSKAIKYEVGKYIGILGLVDKSYVASKKLSGGMKRKLSLCCALCGSARIVLCDEPSSGIDAAGRRSLWELLQNEKIGRTILLTTHYMDEADVLGDRIAILSDGKLQCYGTSFFLKKRYGSGYQLVCIKQADCVVSAVTHLINKHLPRIRPERELGSELTYRLPNRSSKKFAPLLRDLENQSAQLKLDGYGLSVATLEDVFMQVNSTRRLHGEAIDTSEKEAESFTDIIFDIKTREGRKSTRCCMLWQALLLKKALMAARNYWILLIIIFLPVVIMSLTIFNSRGGRIYYNLPSLYITLEQYENAYVILEDKAKVLSSISKEYAEQVKSYGSNYKFINTNGVAFEEYILSQSDSYKYRTYFEYMAAATIADDNITIWLNNKPLHTAPLTLNLLHNALARTFLGKEAKTGVRNAPLPYSKDTMTLRLNKGQRLGVEIAINLALCMSFITAFYAIPIIKERETRAKLLQFLSGVDVCAYWISQFLWDYLTFILSGSMAIITIAAFQESGYNSLSELGRNYVIILLFGCAALPVSYGFSGCFSDCATGFTRIAICNTLTGPGLFMLHMALLFEAFQLKHVADHLDWYFRLFPPYSLASAIQHLHIGYNIRRGCDITAIKLLPKNIRCQNIPVCCNIPDYFGWAWPGVLPEMVYLTVVTIFIFLILIINDAKMCYLFDKNIFWIFQSCWRKKRAEIMGESHFDGLDVNAERLLVQNITSLDRNNIPLLINNISKRYGKKMAVKEISFHVARAECFGLLGINGAGKTSTFKMLTGDEKITSGEAFIEGTNLATHWYKVYRKIGYCPQFDALFEDLTGRQTLRIYCLLRGIQRRYVAAICWALALSFGFQQHMDKQTKHYSGGNKRKLSAAISIIGNPSVLFLDEPTSGMDPKARRHLWRIIGLIRMAGKSIVLTSHSMDECETLCTRLAIMVGGEFKCIGSIQTLKNQYSKGLILKIKVKHKKKILQRVVESSSNEIDITSSKELKDNNISDEMINSHSEIHLLKDTDITTRILNINTFILKSIPDAELKEEYNGLLTYYIPDVKILPKLFQLIENNIKKLNIEDYLIMQTRLEEIFLEFA